MNLEQKRGTIAKVLNINKDELFALMQSPSQYGVLKTKVDNLLNSKELAKNSAVVEAKDILNHAKNYNHYLSILMTYMTGMKVSW